MNRGELRTELLARGFDYLSTTRANQFLEFARAHLDSLYLWPYREESAVGTAPLQISDLGTIEAVIVTSDSNRELVPAEWRWLVATYGDLSVDGTPEYYYIANPSGTLQVATYPESTETIGVQYWEITPSFSADSDTPLAPTAYHDIYLDLAVIMAYRDSDNHGAAEALQAHVDRRVGQMLAQLFTQQVQGPDFQQIRAGSGDW